MLALLLVLSCATAPPDTPEACAAVAAPEAQDRCRAALANEVYQADPEAGVRWVEGIQDPTARDYTWFMLTREVLGGVTNLCCRIEDPLIRERCEGMIRRPHLLPAQAAAVSHVDERARICPIPEYLITECPDGRRQVGLRRADLRIDALRAPLADDAQRAWMRHQVELYSGQLHFCFQMKAAPERMCEAEIPLTLRFEADGRGETTGDEVASPSLAESVRRCMAHRTLFIAREDWPAGPVEVDMTLTPIWP
ncbi:MAG: hypothetical protein H6739_14375 [Alphaproteobacteria bacterium]|nr:hypothetical protein [Alphaproteobacteria bacterium]